MEGSGIQGYGILPGRGSEVFSRLMQCALPQTAVLAGVVGDVLCVCGRVLVTVIEHPVPRTWPLGQLTYTSLGVRVDSPPVSGMFF